MWGGEYNDPAANIPYILTEEYNKAAILKIKSS